MKKRNHWFVYFLLGMSLIGQYALASEVNPDHGNDVKEQLQMILDLNLAADKSTDLTAVDLILRHVGTKPIVLQKSVGYCYLLPNRGIKYSNIHYDVIELATGVKLNCELPKNMAAAPTRESFSVQLRPGESHRVSSSITSRLKRSYAGVLQPEKRYKVFAVFVADDDGTRFGLENVWTGTLFSNSVVFRYSTRD